MKKNIGFVILAVIILAGSCILNGCSSSGEKKADAKPQTEDEQKMNYLN